MKIVKPYSLQKAINLLLIAIVCHKSIFQRTYWFCQKNREIQFPNPSCKTKGEEKLNTKNKNIHDST